MHVEDFVAERTIALCEKQHITMYRLAQMSGIKQSTISNIMKKKTLPNLITLEKICNGFGISLSQFFQEDDMCFSLTDDQKQLMNIWTALEREKRDVIKTILQGMAGTE